MNVTQFAKVFGWIQFAVTALGGALAQGGLPTNPIGWVALAGSLATAVGVHAAAASPGNPVKS